MKKNHIVMFTLLLIGLFGISTIARAEAPVLREQLVYSLTSFNGSGYSKSFCPVTEDTIYLITNEPSVISPRKTIVYFWPITQKYMAGFSTLNEEVAGKLELIQNGKVIETLDKTSYSLYYPEGYYSEKAIVYTDASAIESFKKYQAAVDQFNTQLKQYYENMAQYREAFNRFLEEVRRRREAGDTGPINIPIPQEPKPPEFVQFYSTEPAQGFVLKLPVGSFEIQLRAEDGTLVEGSEKKVVVFTSRRQGGTGYEIIPGNRWTKKENCDEPSLIIHAIGKNELYFNPFLQDEFNELYHNKLVDPQNIGRLERWKWVHVDPIENVKTILGYKQQILQTVDKQPYFVKQIPGPELGYEILNYSEELKQQGYQPTFESYKVILDPNLPKRDYSVSLVQSDNSQPIPQSERVIRLLKKENASYLYAIPFFPLVVALIVILSRRSRIEK